jgi:hypothetical protein
LIFKYLSKKEFNVSIKKYVTILVAAITVSLLTTVFVAASAVKLSMFRMVPPICAAGAAAASHTKRQLIMPMAVYQPYFNHSQPCHSVAP